VRIFLSLIRPSYHHPSTMGRGPPFSLKSLRRNRLAGRVFSFLKADGAPFKLACSVSTGRNNRFQVFCSFGAV